MEAKLVIELDGPLHDKDYDARRDTYMRKEGYRVMRFVNGEVGADFATVLSTVREALRAPLTQPSPRIRGGEG